jgi:phosphoribosylformylglycinamidine synthase subunit PurL
LQAAERSAAAEAGLTELEYNRICQVLEREPNRLELGMFGVLWSEHCSYKHSKPLLRRLPTSGAHVLQGPGENAGAVDIGDDLVAVMKIESHNHPSAVEPYQGAATGVGGILRDIFTMGARPIALMDALCFGDPGSQRTGYLLNGVVSGIAGYGNCVGVPTVGGSITFDSSYTGNPLVNVLCLGLARKGHLLSSRASGPGNPVLLVGSETGRDGIAGASFASAQLTQESDSQRPAVQVGNPFLEKLLIEACLEIADDPDIVAMQDLGAAGLTGAATEMVARGEHGIDVDVALVPRRESGMTPSEVMLSESQERMLLVVRRGAEGRIQTVFERWGLRSAVIGRITDDGSVRIREGSTLVADLPARFLSGGAPEYEGPGNAPHPSAPAVGGLGRPLPSGARRGDFPPLPRAGGEGWGEGADPSQVLLDLLGSPNICSRRSVFEQYDHMVQTNTVVPPGQGSAVLRIKGSQKGLALGLGSGGQACADDPWLGGALAVAEACRNVACAGARPIALTDCLNFGDPERPVVWSALNAVVDGMREACLALDVPIISGNVSLYNETEGEPIIPTPIVGALGVISNVDRHARAVFMEGQTAWLLGGSGKVPRDKVPLSEAGSILDPRPGIELAHSWSSKQLDLDVERRLQECVIELVEAGIVHTATDVGEGGLAVALAELALAGGVGFTARSPWIAGADTSELFEEAPSRIIVASPAEREGDIRAAAARSNVLLTRLGATGGGTIKIGNRISVALDEAHARWSRGLERIGES